MKQLTRWINRITKPSSLPKPPLGKLITPQPRDSIRDYPSNSLTPAQLAAILRLADTGAVSQTMQLFEEMEESKHSVVHTSLGEGFGVEPYRGRLGLGTEVLRERYGVVSPSIAPDPRNLPEKQAFGRHTWIELALEHLTFRSSAIVH